MGTEAVISGTTSAHAENTNISFPGVPGQWNYLHTRGEYFEGLGADLFDLELPPHTRRILDAPPQLKQGFGTTSAHAENTTVHHHRR